jgi:glyoxylase-like metal-dependent hydrolase (beta-lactamase superfamily II)
MTEPAEIAANVEEVRDGVWHWHVHNANIGGHLSSSHAVRFEDADGLAASVLVDPVRLDPHALQQLPPVRAIVLTTRGHQRAAWHYRQLTGAPVWMPLGSTGAEGEPDHTYDAGDELPGGLIALHTPGPGEHHFSLLAPFHGVLIVGDLLSGDAAGRVSLNPVATEADPGATRASVEELLEQPFDVLLLEHGTPVTDSAHERLAAALA